MTTRCRLARPLVTLTAAIFLAPATLGAQQLAVVSRGEDALILHDLATGYITGRIPVGSFAHEVALSPDRRTAFVASYGGNTVTRIDLNSGSALPFDLGDHTSLHGIVVSHQGDRFWVTAEESAAILELDAQTGEIVEQWASEGAQSHMVTVTPNEAKLYVANIRSGTVSVIDRRAGTTTIVATGDGAEGIDVSPDGGEVWVSNRAENSVSVIDTGSDRVVATFSSGGSFPVKVRMRPDGRHVWVANNRSGSVAIFERESRALVKVLEVGARPLGIGFSVDGRRGYVTRPGDDEVVEVDADNLELLRRIPTGDSPDGVVWVPEG